MHAEHSQGKRVRFGERSQAEQRLDDRGVQLFGEFPHLPGRVRDDRSVSDEKDWFSGFLEKACRLFDCRGIGVSRDLVARQVEFVGVLRGAGVGQDIFGQVDKHGPRTSGPCDMEGFLDCAREIVWFLDQEGMLDGRESHAARVAFLESVLSEVRRGRLGGENDDRGRIHQCGVDARERVCRSRAAGNQDDSDLSRGACVAVGHVRCALFVARKDHLDARIENGIEKGNGGASGISEDRIDAFAF